MRFSFISLFFILFLLTPQLAYAKYASIVIDLSTGKTLHEENANTMNYPASLTKMMTLYLLFEAIDRGDLTLKSNFTTSRRASRSPPSRLGLKPGQKISVENAIYALTIKSANDVAIVVAETLAGSEKAFAHLMTDKARELGMVNTYFKNASGLPNKGQLSTARDMAVLGIILMENFPQYYHYFGAKTWTYNNQTFTNHNHLLKSYEGTDGIKTGYTRKSGFNLVASVKRHGHRIIAVVFGGETRAWRDHHIKYLLDRGFKKVSTSE